MNRKLHNTLMALSLSGLTLVVGLFAAGPTTRVSAAAEDPFASAPESPSDWSSGRATSNPADIAAIALRAAEFDAHARSLESRIAERSKAFEAEMARGGDADLGATIASAVAFAAEVSTQAALGAALQAATDHGDQDAVPRVATEAQQQRSHAQRIRGSLAVPYFSFAQGLRRGTGG